MLYLVGTPIGNLGDITRRAIEVLSTVDLVACEDTRRTGILLQSLGIKKPLVSYYKHKEQEGSEYLVSKLREGLLVALVSDAGMPVISDPGAILVDKARQAGIEISVVPGPTAVASAVALAGYDKGFVFIGFLSPKRKDRESQLTPFVNSPLPLVLYCASHDVEDTFLVLYDLLGDRRLSVVKELTKLHEQVIVTRTSHAVDFDTHGEFVLIVEPRPQEDAPTLSPQAHLIKYLEMGMDKKEAVKQVAKERGVKKDEIYKVMLELEDE